VAAHRDATLWSEFDVEVVGKAARDRGEFVIHSGAQASNRGLDEVPEAVELVTPLKVRVARRLSRAAEARVEVAVGFLGRADSRNECVVSLLERRVRAATELPRHALEQLVNFRVHELDAHVVAADRASGRGVEVARPADALDPLLAVREDHGGVELLLVVPEAVDDLDLVWSEWAQCSGGRSNGAAPQGLVNGRQGGPLSLFW